MADDAVSWLIIVVLSLVAMGFLIPKLFGPPYKPGLRLNLNTALDLMNLKPGQTLLHLGSGRGRLMIAAAKRGLKVVGIEPSLLLVIICYLRTRRYRHQVRIVWGKYLYTPWPPADGIFCFMVQYRMPKLVDKIAEWRTQPLKVVSFVFPIPDRTALDSRDGLYLYEYR